MKKLLYALSLLFCTMPCFGQLVLTAASTVNAPIDLNGWQNFKIVLTQNITSFAFTVPVPAPPQATARVVFTQDATGGRTVTFASSITSPCAVSPVASTTTVCQFTFDGVTNTWQGASGVSLTAVSNNTGLQLFNTTTTCTTAGTISTPCTTAAITLPVAYADTNYRIVCNGLATVTGFPQIQTITKSNTTFTITLNNLTAAAASYASFDCVVAHN